MKKFLGVVLVVSLLFSLSACGFSIKLGNTEKVNKGEKSVSIEDREKLLDEREKELEKREKALEKNENIIQNDEDKDIEGKKKDDFLPMDTQNISWVESSETNPAKLGEYVCVEMYNASTGDNDNVYIKVDEIIKGNDAKKIVKDYLDTGKSIYKYSEPDEGLEWVVLKLGLDYSSFDIPDYGKNTSFSNLYIKTIGKNVLYSDEYFTATTPLYVGGSPESVYPNDTSAISYVAVQILSNPVDPIIELGTYDIKGYVEFK